MRISRKAMFMEMATIVARRSTCFRGNVGCIITLDNTPISIGYNGPRAGEDHCYGNKCPLKSGGCTRAVHAEDNAIQRVPDFMTTPAFYHKAELYCTNMPCPHCAIKIIDAGFIGRVYYQHPYRITTGTQDMLSNGIDVYRYSPSGYLIEEETGEVLEAN